MRKILYTESVIARQIMTFPGDVALSALLRGARRKVPLAGLTPFGHVALVPAEPFRATAAVVRAAVAFMNEMATFESAAVSGKTSAGQ